MQDAKLDTLSESISRTKNISYDISKELDEHEQLLDDLDMQTDQSGGCISLFEAMKQIPYILSQIKPGQDLARIKMNSGHSQRRQKAVRAQIDEVKDVMTQNIGNGLQCRSNADRSIAF